MTDLTKQKLSSKIDSGVSFAIAYAVERHRKLGESISIWKDGKVVTLKADEIPPYDKRKKLAEVNSYACGVSASQSR